MTAKTIPYTVTMIKTANLDLSAYRFRICHEPAMLFFNADDGVCRQKMTKLPGEYADLDAAIDAARAFARSADRPNGHVVKVIPAAARPKAFPKNGIAI